jgi:hypothetical protein
MSCIRPATPGFIATLIATGLLAAVSFGVPWIKSVYCLKATVDGVDGSLTLGTLGYCIDYAGKVTCSKPSVGYEIGECMLSLCHLTTVNNTHLQPDLSNRPQPLARQRHKNSGPQRGRQMDNILSCPSHRRVRPSRWIGCLWPPRTRPRSLHGML